MNKKICGNCKIFNSFKNKCQEFDCTQQKDDTGCNIFVGIRRGVNYE